jgi:hypothetical protein
MPTSDVLIYWIYMSCLHAENFQGGYFLLQLAITNDVFASCTNQHIKKTREEGTTNRKKGNIRWGGILFLLQHGLNRGKHFVALGAVSR